MQPDAEFASTGPVDSHHLYAITAFLPEFFLSITMVDKDLKNLLPGIFIRQNGKKQTVSPITCFFF